MGEWETVRIEHVDRFRPTGEVETFRGRKALEIDEKKGWEGSVERYQRDRALSDRAVRPPMALNYRVWTLYEVEGGWRLLVRYFRTTDDKLESLHLFAVMTPREVMGHIPFRVDYQDLLRSLWSRSDLGPPDSNELDGLMDDDDGGGGGDDYGGDEESGLDTDK